MKKYIYALALTFITINISYAQVPDSINYQAVVRNTNGTLIANGKTIRFQFIVNIGSSNYTETQIHTINNVFGLANLKIGTGTVSSAITKLKDLPWEQGNATLKIGIDTAGGTLYTTVSTSSLVTVPYAFYSDKADKAKVADDIANLNFNATTNELTVGNSTTSIPIPLVKRDTIITAFSNNNNLAIIPTAGGALGGGTTYTITAKTQDLAITNTSTNTLTLSKNGIGDNINFNQGNGIKINSTASDINFSIDDAYIKDSIKSFIKDTLKSITRVRFNNTTNKTYIYTPLPKLKLNTTTNILTIYDTLKLLSNTVDLSYFANRDTIVKVVAGLGVSVSPSTTGNVKTFTVNNTAMDKTVVFTPLTGNVTQIGGTYPNFTVYTPKATIDSLDLTSIGGNYMRITIDGKQDQGKIIRSNKLKRIGNIISSKINSPNFNLTETDDSTSLIDGILHKIVAGNLTTTINGINSNPLPIFDTITLKMPLLYNDVTVNGGSNKTITPVLKTQPINTFLAAPSTAAGTPSFRILAETDFPTSVALKTSLTPNRIPKQGAGVYLVDSKLHEVASGNIGWNTVSPLNNFVINGAGSSATFQLTNTLGGATVTSGFVAKFTGTNSFFSTQGDMFFTDNSATPIERLKLTNSDVFVGKNLAGNYISLDLSDKLKIRGNAGATGDVLTSAGPLSPPTWTTPVSASIWDKLGNTIVEKIPTDNVNLGKSSNTNAGVKLAVLPASAFDTAIYAKSFGGYGIIGETTDNTKKNYGIKGITNGIGLATLQNGFVRNTDYSAGIFGESKTATNIITYGVMGKTASTNEQAAGVFGIAELGGSDGVRGISVGTSKGSAGSFLNYATSNSTPTVYISNQDVKDSAAALFVDGGQIVKVEVVTSNHLQNLGDYIIVADNSPQIITLLDPATVPQGTIIIVRNTGSGAMQIALATCISPLSTIDVYSTELQTVVSGVPVYGIMQSGSGNNKVITAIVKTSLKFVSTKTSATVGTWIEY